MTDLAAISDAVVTALNAHEFSQALTVARRWYPTVAEEDIGSTLTAYVVGKNVEVEQIADTTKQRRLHVEVSLWIRPGATDPAAYVDPATIDPYVLLGEEVADFLLGGYVTVGGIDLYCTTTTLGVDDRILSADHLEGLRMVAVLIDATYQETL